MKGEQALTNVRYVCMLTFYSTGGSATAMLPSTEAGRTCQVSRDSAAGTGRKGISVRASGK